MHQFSTLYGCQPASIEYPSTLVMRILKAVWSNNETPTEKKMVLGETNRASAHANPHGCSSSVPLCEHIRFIKEALKLSFLYCLPGGAGVVVVECVSLRWHRRASIFVLGFGIAEPSLELRCVCVGALGVAWSYGGSAIGNSPCRLGIGESFFMVVEAFLRQVSKGDPSSSLLFAPLSSPPVGPTRWGSWRFSSQLYIPGVVGFSNQCLLWSRLFYTLEAHNANGTLVWIYLFSVKNQALESAVRLNQFDLKWSCASAAQVLLFEKISYSGFRKIVGCLMGLVNH